MFLFVNQITAELKNPLKLLHCTGIVYCFAKAISATKACSTTCAVCSIPETFKWPAKSLWTFSSELNSS